MDTMCPTLDDRLVAQAKDEMRKTSEERHVKNVRSRLEAVGLAATRNLSDTDETVPHFET